MKIRSLLLAILLVLLGALTVTAQADGLVYLTVSSITMTYVGDTENIYNGTAPVEDITWTSENPEIVSVENGVLTAVGVGQTVIHAEYEGQSWECTAGCLCVDYDDMILNIPLADRLQPKRIPPLTDFAAGDMFDDAAMVGDSITYIHSQYQMLNHQLGGVTYLCQGGSGINGYLNYTSNIYYQGEKLNLDDAVVKSGVNRLFILLGQNDLGWMSVEDTLKDYASLIDQIRAKSPNVKIYIQTCAQEYAAQDTYNTRNLKIYEFNERLPEFAEEHGCYLVDLAPYLEDHTQRLASKYSLDFGIHVNEDGCSMWNEVLINYMILQQIRGEY